MNRRFLILVALAWAAVPRAPAADAPAPARPTVALKVAVEDHQKSFIATVTVDGKPVENATVALFVKRTFGKLKLGQDQTLDDGTAAVPFPADLPGGPSGKLDVTARITAPPAYTSGVAQAVFASTVPPLPATEAFPRALWAPQAPSALIVTIFVLLGGVWCTFVYVVLQLVVIHKRGGIRT